MPRIKEFFYEGKIAVHREIRQHHPELNAFLGEKHEAGELEGEAVILEEIGAYCNIQLEGGYSPEDIEGLWDMLFIKLRDKTAQRRVNIITSTAQIDKLASGPELLPKLPPKPKH
jgi:hypothetical protein